jgi:hypothetical protein
MEQRPPKRKCVEMNVSILLYGFTNRYVSRNVPLSLPNVWTPILYTTTTTTTTTTTRTIDIARGRLVMVVVIVIVGMVSVMMGSCYRVRGAVRFWRYAI